MPVLRTSRGGAKHKSVRRAFVLSAACLCAACHAADPAGNSAVQPAAARTAAGRDSAPGDDGRQDATLTVGGGTLAVRFSGGAAPVPRGAVLAWVETAAKAASGYFGRFPVRRVDVNVRFDGGGRVGPGVTYSGRRIEIRLGRATRVADLAGDWMLTHEMFHLGFPDMPERYDWMGEGLSTYLEPVARARLGTLSAEKVWKESVEGMPQGLPQAGDRGLDRTPTWGRTYWGGALFWLTADLEIRRRTDTRRSLDDAVRAVLEAGGDGSAYWELDRVLSVGDRATGTTVLAELHARTGPKPESTDIGALWKRLGVVYRDGRVTFDDQAPQAALRKGITRP